MFHVPCSMFHVPCAMCQGLNTATALWLCMPVILHFLHCLNTSHTLAPASLCTLNRPMTAVSFIGNPFGIKWYHDTTSQTFHGGWRNGHTQRPTTNARCTTGGQT